MIEQTFTWTCDGSSCEPRSVQQVRVKGVDYSQGAEGLDGWVKVNGKPDRHYCRRCVSKGLGGQ